MARPGRPERFEPKLWQYELPGGWIVLAGKTDQDNDHLSIKMAGPNDYWFHVRGLPGSHVLLQVPAGRGTGQRDHQGRRRGCRLAQPETRVEAGRRQLHPGPFRDQTAGRQARHRGDPQGKGAEGAAGDSGGSMRVSG